MRKRSVGIASLCGLVFAYFLFRYPLFEWHGMKEFPLYLLAVGILVAAVSGLVYGSRIVPAFTAAGYIVGFFGGFLFAGTSYDPGGGTLNHMWILWMGLFGAAVAAGILIEVFWTKKQKRQ